MRIEISMNISAFLFVCFIGLTGCASYGVPYLMYEDPLIQPSQRALIRTDHRLIITSVDGRDVPQGRVIAVLPGSHGVFVHYYDPAGIWDRASACGFTVVFEAEAGKHYLIEPVSIGTGWKPAVRRAMTSIPVESEIRQRCPTFDDLKRYHEDATGIGLAPSRPQR